MIRWVLFPPRGCPPVRVLRRWPTAIRQSRRATAKRLPACEGIETYAGALARRLATSAKRLPACEGIETILMTLAAIVCASRQEAARL